MNHTLKPFFLGACHPEWIEIINRSLGYMDKDYLDWLFNDKDWLPGFENLFAAFSLPLSKTQYLLVGESPYPRPNSANGYAFWDKAVGSLWSEQGLSKQVNKATSLRNLMKTLLVARGDLHADLSQQAIANVDKSSLVQTADALFTNMMQRGILLLNASLVYSEGKVPYHARKWKPFMQGLFEQLALVKSDIQLILLGAIAKSIPQNNLSVGLVAQHPYNVGFITNQTVLDFFNPLDLLTHDVY
jgi:uracil-DNA glycosylase